MSRGDIVRVCLAAAFGLACWLGAVLATAQVVEDWVARYDAPSHGDDYGTRLAVAPAGGVVVTGQSEGGFYTVAYAADGQVAWSRRDHYATSGRPVALAVDAAGNVYVAGYHDTGWVNSGNQYVVVKYDAAGVRQWQATYDGSGGPYDDLARAVAVDAAGCVYVTGQSWRFDRDGVTTLKFEPNGARSASWPDIGFGTGVRRYEVAGQAGQQSGLAIVVDGAGDVTVAAVSAPATNAAGDYLTIRYDAAGHELWTGRYDGPASAQDTPVGVGLDAEGNVYVAGTSYAPGQSGATRADFATLSYEPDGDLRWVARFNGPIDYEDRCAALAVDAAGNVHVTGTSPVASDDFATIRYDRDGRQVWVAYHDGPAHGTDTARALTLDAHGAVYVTGDVQTESPTSDYETVKYAADGTELWRVGYGGPDGLGDVPTAIVVDGDGGVVVHGSSGGAGTWSDYLTVRYAGPAAAVGDPAAAVAGLVCAPNPVSGAAAIGFTLARPQHVTVRLYDLAGRLVATLAETDCGAGPRHLAFDARDLPDGIYLLRLRAGPVAVTRKLLLLRE